jgi:replicative DNA helicase
MQESTRVSKLTTTTVGMSRVDAMLNNLNPNTKVWITDVEPKALENYTCEELSAEISKREKRATFLDDLDIIMTDLMQKAQQLDIHIEYQVGKFEDFLKD